MVPSWMNDCTTITWTVCDVLYTKQEMSHDISYVCNHIMNGEQTRENACAYNIAESKQSDNYLAEMAIWRRFRRETDQIST